MAQLTIQQAFDLALQHHEAGRLHEAEQLYRQILAHQPEHTGAMHNLGVIANRVGRNDIAVDLIRRVIALRPDFPEAHTNLGNALMAKGQFEEASAAYRQAIVLMPNFPEAYTSLGNAFRFKEQLDEAMTAHRQAIALRPNYAEAHSNLGIVLMAKGQLDEAIAAFRQAILLQPRYPQAHSNLGTALKAEGDLDGAIAACRQAIALKPNYVEAHSNLVFTLNYHPDYDAAAILHHARQFDAQHARALRQAAPPHDNTADPQRRLRIGYVSPDFRLHGVGWFLLPLLAHHHHEAFEITAYSSLHRGDAFTDRLRTHVDGWHDIAGFSDTQAADQIRADRIDILVDLALHGAGHRLLVFARKPCPVQATWLGYPGTTGLSAMDYRLSDPYLDPPGQGDEFYVEKTLRLPHCFWCYQPPEASPEVSALPAVKTGTITFGCFNNFCKVTAPTLDLWAALLRDVKGSQLVIHANAGSHQETVRRRFASAGVDGERIRFVARQPIEEYFAQYGQIDLALDPFPFGGGTTTCDALWMGVPVVSLAGRTAVGRAGVSLLSNLGLPELIAQTPDQYLSIARDLAADLPRLARLRRELRPMMQASMLMDAPRFAADMEAAYRLMWNNWCQTAARPPAGRP